MRIAYLEDAPLPAAAAYSVHTLSTVAAMGELGHDVTLFAPTHAGRIRGAADLEALHRDLALRGRFELRYLLTTRRLPHLYFALAAARARLGGAALAWVRNPRLADFATRAGVRVLLEFHDPPTSDRTRAHLEALCTNDRVVRWVFVSARLREIVCAELPVPPERTVVAHNGVALDLYGNLPARETARRALGLPTAGPVVVHSGHMYEGRGVELLLDVAEAMPELLVVLVGGHGADVARVEAAVADRALTNVVVAGHKPLAELPLYLAAADVLVMPYTSSAVTVDRKTKSMEFASPMKTFEYLAAGRPIVATRFPAVAEVLVDGANAILVPPDSATALQLGIESALADPARSAALAERARLDARERTWVKRTERILAGL